VSGTIVLRASALRRSAAVRREMPLAGAKPARNLRGIRAESARQGRRQPVKLQLAFGQRVELEASALVPQPGVGVGHVAHLDGGGKGRRRSHRTFNLGHHFRCMAGCAHPAQGGHRTLAIDVHLQYGYGMEQRRQFSCVDAIAVLGVQVARAIAPVFAWRTGIRGSGCDGGRGRGRRWRWLGHGRGWRGRRGRWRWLRSACREDAGNADNHAATQTVGHTGVQAGRWRHGVSMRVQFGQGILGGRIFRQKRRLAQQIGI